MRTTSVFLCLGSLILGCAEQDTRSPAENTPMTVQSIVEKVEETVTQDAYPEKVEVLRLLQRANVDVVEGRYSEAFTLAQKALSIDPSSAAASELRDRINEILVRS